MSNPLAPAEEGGVISMEEKKDNVEQAKWEFPRWRATKRRFAPDCSFFYAGNLERELQAKQLSLSISEEEKLAISRLEEEETLRVCCPIVGCGVNLNSLAGLESHYAVRHTATCSVCFNVFPTTRLLNLHISETHDSFFKARVARNYPMYECLVESCSGRFQSDAQRLQHLVDKHQFPRTFRFHTKRHLSQKQRQRQKENAYKETQADCSQKKTLDSKSKSREKNHRPSIKHPEACVLEKPSPSIHEPSPCDMNIDSLTGAVSRLSTSSLIENTPAQVSFGRRRSRACTVPRKSSQKNRALEPTKESDL